MNAAVVADGKKGKREKGKKAATETPRIRAAAGPDLISLVLMVEDKSYGPCSDVYLLNTQ